MSEIASTPLNNLHAEWGGKMTDFAGYRLPLSFAGGGFIAEHLHTRQNASLFDVSHMGQAIIAADAAAALSRLGPADVARIPVGGSKYTVLTLPNGGVMDDLIIGNDGERGFFLVFNAANKTRVLTHLRQHLPPSALQELDGRALVALQGPHAAAAVAAVAPDVLSLSFMHTTWFDFGGADCRVMRGGYTGEDGFEFSLPAAAAEDFARRLTADDQVKPAGLGARDSLRLEAGLCLHGHELDDNTSPIEAGLLWAIPPHRRSGGDYPGAEIIARQIAEGAPRRLVGLLPGGKKIARHGACLQNAAGKTIGQVTSGLHSPSLQTAIALGYVLADAASQAITAEVRGEWTPCTTVKLPFIAHNYHRGKSS